MVDFFTVNVGKYTIHGCYGYRYDQHCLFPRNHVNDCSWKCSTSTNPGPSLKVRDGGWHDQMRSTHWSLEHFRAMQNMHLWTIRSAKRISPYPTIINLLLHFLKFSLQHVWIPSRKTGKQKTSSIKTHTFFVTLFYLWILFGPVIFWNLNHPIIDVTHLGQSWARHTP